MTRLGWAATAPLRLATRVRRLGSARWPRLPAPSVCVGNLALGGRGKTPLVAGLAAALPGRVGVIARGYPVTSRSAPPRLLLCTRPHGAPWLAELSLDGRAPVPAWRLASEVGDEAPWLAAVTGAPVAVHPDRIAAASALSAAYDVDLLFLDDGLQAPVHADLDVVLVDPDRDLRRRAMLREGLDAHSHALVVPVGGHSAQLRRRVGGLRDLRTGAEVSAPEGPVCLAAAVGDPASVRALATQAGVPIGSELRLRDHHGPRRAPRGPLLVTEKDAVGWAMERGSEAVVLGLRLDGVEEVADAVSHRLAAL